MHEEDVWEFIEERLRGGESAVLLVVVRAVGATPGKPGFKMAVAPGGALCGTVGGGALEHRLVERARAMLGAGESDGVLIRHEMPEAGGEEPLQMLCGGAQTVALCPLAPADLSTIRQLLSRLREGETVRLRLTTEGMDWRTPGPKEDRYAFEQTADGPWAYEQTLGRTATVYIIGGGHVGLALSRALAPLDVRIVVMDERPDVDTLLRNRWAHEKHILPFESVAGHIPDGKDTYVVIATHRHSADECVLRQLVRRRLRYLGMMGSKAKVREIMDRLRADGFAEQELQRVHAPIGLPIGSHTPAEIAISITAEIIKVRNAG